MSVTALTPFELKVLRSINGEDVPDIHYGAAMTEAMEYLRSQGYIAYGIGGGTITDKGRIALIQADPKAHLTPSDKYALGTGWADDITLSELWGDDAKTPSELAGLSSCYEEALRLELEAEPLRDKAEQHRRNSNIAFFLAVCFALLSITSLIAAWVL